MQRPVATWRSWTFLLAIRPDGVRQVAGQGRLLLEVLLAAQPKKQCARMGGFVPTFTVQQAVAAEIA
eukprot:CAMPEP_0180796278 /NCGR_PEP_ID=MMETSP1038_2-20121128/56692_1 /TAXON_ID=632150 /ORGANISM="Azadinium spinosum, Strain 3D9" /LENGTH=66 /DNA_ID=CAMNT_0022835343 /DNA_START=79 /DNA_END=277 /DNA_ORIENTATION=-